MTDRKLTRITIGEIGDLVDPNKVNPVSTLYSLTQIRIKEKNKLIIEQSSGIRPCSTCVRINESRTGGRIEFLSIVDEYLEREGLYLARTNYNYKRDQLDNDCPYAELEGRLFKEREAQKRVTDLPEEGDAIDG